MVGGVGGWMARPQIYVRPSLDPVPLVVHGKRPQVSVRGGGGRREVGGGRREGGGGGGVWGASATTNNGPDQ